VLCVTRTGWAGLLLACLFLIICVMLTAPPIVHTGRDVEGRRTWNEAVVANLTTSPSYSWSTRNYEKSRETSGYVVWGPRFQTETSEYEAVVPIALPLNYLPQILFRAKNYLEIRILRGNVITAGRGGGGGGNSGRRSFAVSKICIFTKS
jgi:hypothetical protein